MNGKFKKFQGSLFALTLITSLVMFSLCIVPSAEAHILVVGAPSPDLPDSYYQDAKDIANKLKAHGYDSSNIVELYKENATAKNILKGMYNADLVIYIGHGGYEYGHYDNNGGTATPPFSIVGYAPENDYSGNEFIWGIDEQMREGWSSNLFTAPFKQDIPVMLFHACFSTGDVEDKQVANPVETIYNFAQMFTGAGANYYASAWFDSGIIDTFLNGANNFTEANNKISYAPEKFTKSYTYNGTTIWRSIGGDVAFIGDLGAKFPGVSQISKYNPYAAEAWYNSDRSKALVSAFYGNSTQYANQLFTLKEYSNDIGSQIINYTWDFGDGTIQEFASPTDVTHSYTSLGQFTVKHTVTNNLGQTSTSNKTISVVNRPPVANFKYSATKYVPGTPIQFTSTSYDLDKDDTIVSYLWNFGDGQTSTEINPVHTYSKEGNYKVSLKVNDTAGNTNTKSVTFFVGTKKPDLVITKVRKSGSYLYVTIKNQGNAGASKFYARAWYGKSPYKKYKNIYVSYLNPGLSKTYKVKYYYRHGTVKVDFFNKVSEKSEKNNIRAF